MCFLRTPLLLECICRYRCTPRHVLHLLKISGSIDYCRTLVNEHLNSAIREIDFIEDNPAKKMVLELDFFTGFYGEFEFFWELVDGGFEEY